MPSKEYYKDDQTLRSYSETIGSVLEALLLESAPNVTDRILVSERLATNSETLVRDLVAFESKLAAATPSEEEAEDVTQYYNPKTLEETRALLPQLSIQYIIAGLAPAGYSTDRIIVGSPSYLKALATILRSTSAETLQAYFVWKTVQQYASKVEDKALKPLLRFNNRLQGKDADATEIRSRTCIKVVDNGLGKYLIALSNPTHIYVTLPSNIASFQPGCTGQEADHLIFGLQAGYSQNSSSRKLFQRKRKISAIASSPILKSSSLKSSN